MRRLLLALTLLLAIAAPATAAPSHKKAIWGPVEVNGVDQFPLYQDLGVGIFQYTLNWSEVAPTRPANPSDPADPAYRWPAELDEAIGDARPRGIQISIMLIGAPSWANNSDDQRTAPTDPKLFGDFAQAAARRYPYAKYWMIWSEPTKALNFQPLIDTSGKKLVGAQQLEGPRRYAELLDASYGSIHAVNPTARVIGGNTFTTGTVRPQQWIQALRMRNGKRPRMDLWGHNPFSLRTPKLSQPPLGDGYADFGDLDTLMQWLDKAKFRTPGGKKLPLFLSEYSLPTDHANYEFNFYVTRAKQATWLKDAYKEARKSSRIFTLGYLGLYDDAPRALGDQVERGLITLDGTKKPGYYAYKGA